MAREIDWSWTFSVCPDRPPMTPEEWDADQKDIAEMDAAAEARIEEQGKRDMQTIQEIYDLECQPDPPDEDDDEDDQAAA